MRAEESQPGPRRHAVIESQRRLSGEDKGLTPSTTGAAQPLHPVLERFSRQIPIIGVQGQYRLSSSSVLVVGAGGLGSPVITYLTCAGVGRLVIVDGDRVEPSNLNRQFLYRESDIGRWKALVAAERVRELNSGVRVEAYPALLDESLARRLVPSVDLVVDALDNWATRLILNRVVVEEGVPLIHGGVDRMYGQVMTVLPGKTACLQCIAPRGAERIRGGAVLGPVAGVVGSIEALEAIRILAGLGPSLAGQMLIVDCSGMVFEKIPVRRSPSCPVCGSKQPSA
ncbi:MAG: HesA/MoeB/ThiF family protein [Crenarchaeota archaeon]|nr:HesA/MoeB/ThiF family protein [Thermoproteota archaeon]